MKLDKKQKQIILGRINSGINAAENIDTQIYKLRKAMMDLSGDFHAVRRFIENITIPEAKEGDDEA